MTKLSRDMSRVLVWMHTMDILRKQQSWHQVASRRTFGMAGREILRPQAKAFLDRGLAEEHPNNRNATKERGMWIQIRLNDEGTKLAAEIVERLENARKMLEGEDEEL